MKLKELQKQFARQIYYPKDKQIFDEIDQKTIPANIRIDIYRNNIFGNFTSVLEIIYPSLKKIVGDDYFENLCIKYRQKHPSTSGNLDDYGQYFAKLIGELKKEHKLPYLKDIANLEWRYHRAYFGKDVASFKIEEFQKLEEKTFSKVKFKLHPSCVLISSKYPIFSIWKSADFVKNLDLGKISQELILINRAKFDVDIYELSPVEFLFLKKIQKRYNFYQIYEELDKEFTDFDIGILMNKFISNGTIANYGI